MNDLSSSNTNNANWHESDWYKEWIQLAKSNNQHYPTHKWVCFVEKGNVIWEYRDIYDCN